MKSLRMMLVLALALLVSATLNAQTDCEDFHNPDGYYTTQGGGLLPGRVSEANCAGEGAGYPGNTQDAMSWDGSALMTQWHVWGMQIDENGAQYAGSYDDGSGNGWIDYTTNYTGGNFWLSATGPWGDGSMEYTGTLNYYNVSTRVTLVGGVPVGKTSNVTFTGDFDTMDCYDCSLEFVIANALLVWDSTSGSPRPDDYPDFLCGATDGELYDACCINARVICGEVDADQSTWGAIKELYR